MVLPWKLTHHDCPGSCSFTALTNTNPCKKVKQFWGTVSQHNLPLLYNRNTQIDILSQESRHKENYGVMQESPVSPISDAWIWNDCTKKVKKLWKLPQNNICFFIFTFFFFNCKVSIFPVELGYFYIFFISQYFSNLFIWQLLVINSQLQVKIVQFCLFSWFCILSLCLTILSSANSAYFNFFFLRTDYI